MRPEDGDGGEGDLPPDRDNGPAVVAYLQSRALAPAGLVVREHWAKAVRCHLLANGGQNKVVWALVDDLHAHSSCEPYVVVLEREADHPRRPGTLGPYRWAVFYQHPCVSVGRASKTPVRHIEAEYDLIRRVQIPLWNGKARDRNGLPARPKPIPVELAIMEAFA